MATTTNIPGGWTVTETNESSGGSWSNRGMTVVSSITSSSTERTRRVRPLGVELLFNGQGYNRERRVTSSPLMSINLPLNYYGTKYRYTGEVNYDAAVGESVWNWAVPAEDLAVPLTANEIRLLIKGQKLDLMTDLAEGRQTVALMKSLYKPLTTQLEDYAQKASKLKRLAKLGKKLPGRGFTKALADLHLAYVFGVKPLIGELCGTYELLVEKLTDVGHPVVRATQIRRGLHTFSNTGNQYFAGTFRQRILSGTYRTSYRYVAYGQLAPVHDARDFARLGLNPLNTLWELLPWSFAVDRFIQIGDALQSLDAFSGLTRTVCYETYKVEAEAQGDFAGQLTTWGTFTKTDRRVIGVLDWEPPSTQNLFGAKQVLTYTALARQLLSKVAPKFII